MFASLNNLLRDRISSPLYSTFIFSWLVINWKILYLTFFISEERIHTSKIDYILCNYLNWTYGLWLPLGSTTILLLIVPFIDYGTFTVHLWFKSLFRERQYKFDSSSRLSVEQSRQIKKELHDERNTHDREIKYKDAVIAQLEEKEKALETEATDLRTRLKESQKNEADAKALLESIPPAGVRISDKAYLMSAYYGNSGKYNNVTSVIGSYMQKEEEFAVTNDTMHGDPIHGTAKVIYVELELASGVDIKKLREHRKYRWNGEDFVDIGAV